MQAWIGLGGNREDSGDLMGRALSRLSAEPDVRVLRRSRLYRSAPWGRTDQPDFVNAVAELETALQPEPLLHLLLETERQLGRDRSGPRWGPRCIDLDLLTYEGLRLQSDELVLPHPRMPLRAFVLVPLLELDPDFVIPGVGPAADCLRRIDPAETALVVVQSPRLEECKP
jgi:2-amino-4-hydroxy-6-hydroxymethyldihydropteridine diphosphokinase